MKKLQVVDRTDYSAPPPLRGSPPLPLRLARSLLVSDISAIVAMGRPVAEQEAAGPDPAVLQLSVALSDILAHSFEGSASGFLCGCALSASLAWRCLPACALTAGPIISDSQAVQRPPHHAVLEAPSLRLLPQRKMVRRNQDQVPAQILISFSRSRSRRYTTSLSFVDGCFGADLLLRIVAIFLPVPKPGQTTPAAAPDTAGPVAPTSTQLDQASTSAAASQAPATDAADIPAPAAGAEQQAVTGPALPPDRDKRAGPSSLQSGAAQQIEAPPVKTARFSLTIVRCRVACHDWRAPAPNRRPGMLALSLDLPDVVLQLPLRQPLQHPAQHAVQLLTGDFNEAFQASQKLEMGQLSSRVQAAFAARYV